MKEICCQWQKRFIRRMEIKFLYKLLSECKHSFTSFCICINTCSYIILYLSITSLEHTCSSLLCCARTIRHIFADSLLQQGISFPNKISNTRTAIGILRHAVKSCGQSKKAHEYSYLSQVGQTSYVVLLLYLN